MPEPLPSSSPSVGGEPVIRAEGLTKSYGSFRALRGVELEVRRGEIFGFLGSNGAGKTTAIRCLLDLIRPDGGTLRVLGLDPQESPVEVRRRCGYLPGELRLDENMRVGAALDFFQQLRGGGAEMRGRAGDLAARLELRTDAKIKNLSKGNKQKVGIVAAFMHVPELLLLDEPTSGLDPLVQQTVLQMVRDARAAGATVFFSSHVLAEVQNIADRVAIIRGGEVVKTGVTADLARGRLLEVRVAFNVRDKPGPVGLEILRDLPGVSLAGMSEGGRVLELTVDGGLDSLVKYLAVYEVQSLETQQQDLEEVFLAHYGIAGRAAVEEDAKA